MTIRNLLLSILMTAVFVAMGTDESAKVDRPFRVEMSIWKTEYFVYEPIAITVYWKNVTDKEVEASWEKMEESLGARIACGEKPARAFRLYRVPEGIPNASVTYRGGGKKIAPGQAISLSLLLAQTNMKPQEEDEALLKEPGEYRIYQEAKGRASGVTFRVSEPVIGEDKAALDIWREKGILDLDPISKGIEALQRIRHEHPNSLYAQYARLGIVEKISISDKGTEGERILTEKKESLGEILRETVRSPVVERACMLGIPLSKYSDKLRLLARLATEYPESTYLPAALSQVGAGGGETEKTKWVIANLKGLGAKLDKKTLEAWGVSEDYVRGIAPIAPGSDEKPIYTNEIELDLGEVFLRVLPPDAREAFFGYFRSTCRRDVKGAMAFLADDFVGDEGDKASREKMWEKHLPRSDMKRMVIGISGTKKSNSYERAGNLPKGGRRSWEGEILVVHGVVTATYASGVRTSADKTWALKKQMDGKWAFISERSEGSIHVPVDTGVPTDSAWRFPSNRSTPDIATIALVAVGGALFGAVVAILLMRRKRRPVPKPNADQKTDNSDGSMN